MGSTSVVDLIEASSGVHFSGFHMDALKQRIKEIEVPTTSATEDLHKQPFVIGKLSFLLHLYPRHQLSNIPYGRGCWGSCIW